MLYKISHPIFVIRYLIQFYGLGLRIWCLTPLSTLFQLYRDGQFYWWRKPEYSEKTNRPVASKWKTLSHNVVHLAMRGIRVNILLWWWALIAQVVVNQTTIRSRPWRPLVWVYEISDQSYKIPLKYCKIYYIQYTYKCTLSENIKFICTSFRNK